MEWKPLPIGVDNFENLITKGYYFIDKTLFIRDLLDMKGEVNLFTRPRRFGKTLNMSMLRYFFENGVDIPLIPFAIAAGIVADLYCSGVLGLYMVLYPCIVAKKRQAWSLKYL